MNPIIRALVVDDEELARQALKIELQAFPEIEICGECANGFEAVKAVTELQPDLLFLDIQMPKLDGFDTLELLGDKAPAVVFVTAHDEYALKAFEARALDYLLKPARAERLRPCLERVKKMISEKRLEPHDELLLEHRKNQAPLTRILVRIGPEVHIVPVREIGYIEAQDDYIKLYAAGKSYLKSERMNRIEGLLDGRQFCRIHRSYILNIDYLKKIEPYTRDSFVAKLKTGETLPVSRPGYARLKELL